MHVLKSAAAVLLLSAGMLLPGLTNQIALADEAPTARAERPVLDLAFLIDTTGSMGGEIEMVKKKTKDLVAKLASGKPAPIVRVGLVAYRDRGDDYVTKVFPFSDDIDKVVKDITALNAAGGGDTPEAVNQGLHAALNDLEWTKNKKASKLLFLIGDAAPHIYPNDFTWEAEAKNAISRGIQINTIGCDGLDSSGTTVFEKIAKLADGSFETLAYRQEIVNSEGKKETLITSGGSTYRVRAGSEESWKAGAKDLEARGLAVAAPAPVASMGKSGRAMMPTSFMARRASMHSESAFAAAGAPGAGGAVASYGGVNRGDSNLDDVMLNAAKSKLKKDASIIYTK
ncbi:MAG TPA: VWA domain-containing protein [Candidatus Melainabacteria bacterium]|nr:VWA domain-containing protein [Candidatus Melainabacteria bacterium]HIN66686.1 VWA domain-containing protein [Candidatus Obscuribacterales bacterium]